MGYDRGMRSLLASLLVAALLASPAAAAGWLIEGSVVGIIDGATLTVLDGANTQHKVRVAGIDAPERGQPFGTASKASLSHLTFNRHVHAYCRKRHRDRIVCDVFEGSRAVGLEQVRAGMAWHATAYQHEQTPEERDQYARAERAARADRRGLWIDPDPIPPWEWRKSEAK
jgi:endonuclease YncB( thermonuclease family)